MKKLAILTILAGCLIAFNSCKEPEPISVAIKQISITSLPLGTWERIPNVFFTLSNESVSATAIGPVVENVTASRLASGLTWEFKETYRINNFDAKTSIKVWDKNGEDDVEMGTVEFTMNTYSKENPEIINITQNGITVKLEVTWIFDK